MILNKSMKFTILDKVDLEGISNNFWYATVAFLVDKEEFIREVKKARKVLGLKRPMDYSDAKKWLYFKNKEKSLKELTKEEKELFLKRLQLNTIADNIKNKFHRGINYTEIIKYAILAGRVTDKENIFSLYCGQYPFSKEFEEIDLFNEEPLIAILINPETKINEISKLMKTKVRKLFGELNRNYKIPRVSQNIRRDREWYWTKRLGKSYQEISNIFSDKTLKDRDIVIKAIKQYQRHLGVEK